MTFKEHAPGYAGEFLARWRIGEDLLIGGHAYKAEIGET